MKRVFIDTNVFIDYIAKRENFFEASALVIQLCKSKKMELLISSLSFATASFILQAHHKLNHQAIVSKFSDFVSLCNVTPVDSQTIEESISSEFQDFEDAMQFYSAKRKAADAIITRNKDDFTVSDIPIYNPIEFIGFLKNKK